MAMIPSKILLTETLRYDFLPTFQTHHFLLPTLNLTLLVPGGLDIFLSTFLGIYFIGLKGSYDIFRKSQEVSARTLDHKGVYGTIF